jgi:hypothetical protein
MGEPSKSARDELYVPEAFEDVCSSLFSLHSAPNKTDLSRIDAWTFNPISKLSTAQIPSC